MRDTNLRAFSAVILLLGLPLFSGRASAAKGLEIYFVDTEGGAATLIVSPAR